jgi:mRNA interferase MazF
MRAGDVVAVDFGVPQGSEPGFRRPAVVITADHVLAAGPRVVHVVPITSNTARNLPTEVGVSAEGLGRPSAAQCHLCTVVSTSRLDHGHLGSVGPAELAQVRSLLGDLFDIP